MEDVSNYFQVHVGEERFLSAANVLEMYLKFNKFARPVMFFCDLFESETDIQYIERNIKRCRTEAETTVKTTGK